MLQAILLYGRATYVGDPSLIACAETEQLESEDLLRIIREDPSKEVRASLAHGYKLAFDAYRELEDNVFSSPVISLDGAHASKRYRRQQYRRLLRAQTDAANGEEALRRHLDRVVPLMADVFTTHLNDNVNFVGSFLEDVFGDIARGLADLTGNISVGLPQHYSIDDVLAQLGLQVRPAEEIERALPVMTFYPDDLRLLWEQDAELTQPSPMGFMASGANLSLRGDPLAYLWLHAFWRTVFELQNMVSISSAGEGPLFLPSSTNLGNRSLGEIPRTTEMTALFRMFLSHRTSIPRLQSISDILRLRDDRRLEPMKEVLATWTASVANGDLQYVSRIEKDIQLAERAVRKGAKISRVGQMLGIAAVPMAAVDLLAGLPVGTVVGAVGVGLDQYGKLSARGAQWVQFGF
jgi:hypothetical protein